MRIFVLRHNKIMIRNAKLIMYSLDFGSDLSKSREKPVDNAMMPARISKRMRVRSDLNVILLEERTQPTMVEMAMMRLAGIRVA